jgi:hypothetical protein
MPSDFASIRNAQALHDEALIARPDVLGVSVGYRTARGNWTDEPALKVFVPTKLPERLLSALRLLPKYVAASDGDAVRVDVEELAPLTAPSLLDSSTARAVNDHFNAALRNGRAPGRADATVTALAATIAPSAFEIFRSRPARGGDSVAHPYAAAGTLAIAYGDAGRTTAHIVSCSHVLALAGRAPWGAPVMQPAPIYGGTLPADYFGYLSRSVPLFAAPAAFNIVDGAVASVSPSTVITGEVAALGLVRGIRPLHTIALGERVRRVGATTGVLQGYVIGVNATLKINYGALGLGWWNYIFRSQVLTTPMAAFGDSGALLLDDGNAAIGMLFAGSITATGFNPIEEVQRQLHVMLESPVISRQGFIALAAGTPGGFSSAFEPTRDSHDVPAMGAQPGTSVPPETHDVRSQPISGAPTSKNRSRPTKEALSERRARRPRRH